MPTAISGLNGVSQIQDGTVSTAAKLAAGVVNQSKFDTIGTVGSNGPAFSAYGSTPTSLPGAVTTKLAFQTKEFDFGGYFDNVTNFRYTPLVAGLYQVIGGFGVSTVPAVLIFYVVKNGSAGKTIASSNTANLTQANGSCLIQMNGTTDYLELFGYQGGATQNSSSGISSMFFQACLIRSA